MQSREQNLHEAPGPRRFRVAVVQAASVAFDLERTLEKVRRLAGSEARPLPRKEEAPFHRGQRLATRSTSG